MDKTIYLWVNINGFKGLFYYLIDADAFPKDLMSYFIFKKYGFKVSIIFNKSVTKLKGETIFYNFTYLTDYIGFKDNHGVLFYILKSLKKQLNVLVPSYENALLWENKAYMYEKLMEVGIDIPYTEIINIEEPAIPKRFSFPFLIKEEHNRGSLGVHKIENIEQYNTLINDRNFKQLNDYIIFQELINMRQDLRVVCIGNSVELNFWRINPKSKWLPTSTKYGSYVRFDDFPKKWENTILKIHKKLDLTTSGFDFVWRDDDLNNPPLVLEVSPSYQPNPPIDHDKLNTTYGEYKKEFRFSNSFNKIFLDILFNLQKKYIKQLIVDYKL